MKKNKLILFIVNVDWFFISHRLVIAEEAKKNGFDVVVAGEDTGRSQEISDKGIQFINLNISRSGINPIIELLTIVKLYKIYSSLKPNIVHQITLKPVIYGSIIAKVLNIKSIVNAVSGLGYNFTGRKNSLVSKIMLWFMKYGFKNNRVSIIFQNKDDFKELYDLKVISPINRVFFIKGSGVNLKEFYPAPFPSFEIIKIVLPVRMLLDKGVNELKLATEILKGKYSNKIQFILAGMADEDNKSGISSSFLNEWQDGKYVKWIGYQKNIFEVYKNSHIVILPSYREGMPKTLIEGCAMGRAIITTNAIGCRECVDEGVNGLKVPVKDPVSLARAIEELVNNSHKIVEMGEASRLKALKEFDINIVLRNHIEIYNQSL